MAWRARCLGVGRALAFALVVLLLEPCTSGAPTAAKPCAPGCTERGVCNPELGRCDCHRNFTGDSCSEPIKSLSRSCKHHGFPSVEDCVQLTPYRCLNNCNERGTCYGGWCHCQEGYYGADCSLSLDSQGRPEQLAGMGFKPAPEGPRIYIYELPARFTTHKDLNKFDRPLFAHIWKRIVSSGHRTLDPDEADYFYIPVDFRYMFSEAMLVLQYVWTTWPHWNATGGARHLLLSTSDLGGCEGKQLMRIRNITAQSIWVTPWGLTRKHPRVWWPGCHRPGLDIVIPIPAQTNQMLMTPLNPKIKPQERNITFYFAGKICGDNKDPREDTSAWPICQTPTNPLYSAGQRQQVYFHHSKRPGYKIVPRSRSYVQDMSTSKFCLAPTGGGHGKRQVLVARFGCIPVPITDFVLQPFEPELDWEAFSVTVKEADVPQMHETLAAIDDDRLKKMQKALACASKHLWWSSLWGGIFGDDGRYDAFATLMEILRVRLRHPGAPPEKYRQLDERFRKFADCELDDEPPRNVTLCSYGYDRGLESYAPTPYCQWNRYGKYGIPGGAICEGAKNIAECPRPWQ
ncbi:hypothetical protein HYH03_013231 [Edaphochlamys debaryana]|uniref:EGF-like domain-containing protein n=1 Tax=Edaphochlamys debaryana TaxID=47281 RepID=A0A835XWQ4_9CHLO|nr:hypothetical protein HYH03_013231 [Edaphochlamys debaryana]|eukprot:KAG2488240.1 hypothetical protein HYH03_013231 [Edaphochlamys debaryana]